MRATHLPVVLWLPLALYAGLFVAINVIALLAFPFMLKAPMGFVAVLAILAVGSYIHGKGQQIAVYGALLTLFPILFGLAGFGWALAAFSIPAAPAGALALLSAHESRGASG